MNEQTAQPSLSVPQTGDGEETPTSLSQNLGRRLVVPMIIAVLAYGALLLYADAGAIAKHASQVPVLVLLGATGLAIANFVFRFFRWQYYLRQLDISIPTFDSALTFIAGFSMSITPGKVGEVIKSLLLKRAHNVSMVVSAPIVLAERITDLAALLLLFSIYMLLRGHN
ncbi:MAG: lysylphosphatidylglycerol synthase transmembrane domain-containing protein, partial [Myxococcota bacterium]